MNTMDNIFTSTPENIEYSFNYLNDCPPTNDPVECIQYIMLQNNLSRKDLVEIIGSDSTTSRILNYRRKLTLEMIRKLHKELFIPLEVLIKDYELR